jgi:restriction system protein
VQALEDPPCTATNIHAFRSVVNDLGANIGYIISLRGFQSGAFKSSKLTNVELVTWEEFQQRFFESWYEEYFAPEVARQLDEVLTYSEPVIVKWARWLDKMSDDDKREFLALKDQYDIFGYLMMTYTPYVRAFEYIEG